MSENREETLTGLAQITGRSYNTLLKAAQEGRLDARKSGGVWLARPAALERAIESGRMRAPETPPALYYPVAIQYVGPRAERTTLLDRRIRVLAKPDLTNLSLEPRTEGDLGTTGSWSKHALGEMDAAEVRELLQEHGVKIPDGIPVRYAEYSYGHPSSDAWNLRHAHPAPCAKGCGNYVSVSDILAGHSLCLMCRR